MYWKSSITKLIIPFTIVEIAIFLYSNTTMYSCECFSNHVPSITLLAWLIFLIATVILVIIKKSEWKIYHAIISIIIFVIFLMVATNIGKILYPYYAPQIYFWFVVTKHVLMASSPWSNGDRIWFRQICKIFTVTLYRYIPRNKYPKFHIS